jgi:hypothetical protein
MWTLSMSAANETGVIHCEIGNLQFDLHQLHQRSPEPFGLPVGQLKQFPQNQQAFDRRVAVEKRVPSPLLGVGVMPPAYHVLAKPKGNRSPLHERLVVLPPIRDSVRTFACSGHVESPFRGRFGSVSNHSYVLNR